MTATIVKAGDRPPLNILGMPLTMLCEARETGAELVLTSSALCQRSFADLKQAALPVQDLLEFALQAV